MIGYIHSIETLAAVDGPGVRTAIFLQGCPQRCIYCHNPDTWQKNGGQEMSADELIKKVIRFKPYYKNDGGVTLSGGEPFMQVDFVIELLKKLKDEKIHTAVDTCGYFLNDKVKIALEYVDLVLLDIKHTDANTFEKITGVPIDYSMAFLDYMKKIKKPLWIRQVIVPGYTDSEEQIKNLLKLLEGANVERVDLLPYHTLGVSKWEQLGIEYPIPEVKPPEREIMIKLNKIVEAKYPKGADENECKRSDYSEEKYSKIHRTGC
ncbi:MAG: pyruvate formate-lyase-activating protein [Clostridia bacterium]|nr:pyruvate formate-lyase-activating protein [Clostridia bacterium]